MSDLPSTLPTEISHSQFLQVLRLGIEKGWCSEVTCVTHDSIPHTKEEVERWEAGEDPCAPVIRLYDVD